MTEAIRHADTRAQPGDENGCRDCERLRYVDSRERDFTMVPSAGGGWEAWSAALLRLLERVGHGPTRAIVISQTYWTMRYVQVMIGHGIAIAEASSNRFHVGDDRLSLSERRALEALGWKPPSYDGADGSPNYSFGLVHADWGSLTELVAATMIGVFGFSEHAAVEIHSFDCVDLCRSCSWPESPAPEPEQSAIREWCR